MYKILVQDVRFDSNKLSQAIYFIQNVLLFKHNLCCSHSLENCVCELQDRSASIRLNGKPTIETEEIISEMDQRISSSWVQHCLQYCYAKPRIPQNVCKTMK